MFFKHCGRIDQPDFCSRLEREKLMLEGRAKAAAKDLQVNTNVLTVKLDELKLENLKLKDDMAALSHNQLMGGEPGLETLRLKNKFLQVIVVPEISHRILNIFCQP